MLSKIRSCYYFLVIIFGLSWADKFNQFNIDCLREHNQIRKNHGAQDLILDQGLIDFAQNWANQLANENKFYHRPENSFGENLYAASGMKITGDLPVDSWYSEKKDYNYSDPGFNMNSGHFTQVVWKETKKVGCAFATGKRFTYVVANYDPPGNYLGQFEQNVQPEN